MGKVKKWLTSLTASLLITSLAGQAAPLAYAAGDTTPPKIADFGIVGDEDGSTTFYFGTGRKMTFKIRFNEPVLVTNPNSVFFYTNSHVTPYYTTGSGTDTLYLTYTVKPGDDLMDTNLGFSGSVSFYGITDLAGNPYSWPNMESGVQPYNVKYDIRLETSSPTLTLVEPTTSSCLRGAVQATASDPVGFGSKGVTLYYTWLPEGQLPDWSTVTDTMPSGLVQCAPADPTMDQGPYELHVRAVDDVGNTTDKTSRSFLLDTEGPELSMYPTEGAKAKSHSVNVYASEFQWQAGVKSVTYTWLNKDTGERTDPATLSTTGGSITTPYKDGSYELTVTATDNFDNQTVVKSTGVYVVDAQGPSIGFDPDGVSTADKSHATTVSLSDAKSALGSAYYAWADKVDYRPQDGWVPPAGWQMLGGAAASVTTPTNATGTYYLYVKAEDELHNASYNVSGGFLLDNDPPTSSFVTNGSDVPVKTFSTDLNVPGDFASMDYVVDQDPTAGTYDYVLGWTHTTTPTISINEGNGTYFIHALIRDQVGNGYSLTSRGIKLDNQGPAGQVVPEKAYTNGDSISVDLTAQDDSTVTDVRIKGPDGVWSDWMSYEESKTVALAAAEGEQTIQAQFQDALGNEGTVASAKVVRDKTPPRIAETSGDTDTPTQGPVNVHLVAADNYSASDRIRFVQGSADLVFNENSSQTVTIEDEAGNRADHTVTVANIDQAAPVVTLTESDTLKRHKSAIVKVEASDQATPDAGALRLYAFWAPVSPTDPYVEPSDWSAARQLQSGESLTLDDADGSWALWVKAVDPAGNATIVRSHLFLLDNTPPVGSITYSTTTRTAGSVTAYLSTDEPVTVTSPSTGLPEYTFSVNGSFTFAFMDEAGNVGTAAATVEQIDDTLPQADVNVTPSSWTNEPVDVTVSVGDRPAALHALDWTGTAGVRSLTTVEGAVYEPEGDAFFIAPDKVATALTGGVRIAVVRFDTNGSLSYLVRDRDTGLENTDSVLVNRIDLTPPELQVRYSETRPTNQDVTVTLDVQESQSGYTIMNNGGSHTYTFTENGTFTFLVQDGAGNQASITATAANIDKSVPQPQLIYSETGWTRQNVMATVTFPQESGPITITNNGGSEQYTFTQNGSMTFFFRDQAGNSGQITAVVSKIDREAPIGTLRYSTRQWTNQDVTVQVVATDNGGEPVQFIGNGGSTYYTFAENGSFTFKLADAAGNMSELTAVVDRIDKTPPAAEVLYSTTAPTNGSVRATVTANESITVANNAGSRSYDFEQNGAFTFRVRDAAGNEVSVPANVANIDRTAPKPTVVYSKTGATKDPVIATVGADEPIVVLNNAHKPQYVFGDNGTFVFQVADLAGNVAEIEAQVANIDKTPPVVTLTYSETAPTRQDVTVTVTANRAFTVRSGDGSDRLVYTANGGRWIELVDALGNEVRVRAEVTNIDRETPVLQFANGLDLVVPLGQPVDVRAGVTATDGVDGDVTGRVQINSPSDYPEAGTYEAVYTVADTAGNTAVVKRKIVVLAPGEFQVYVNAQEVPVRADAEFIVYNDTLRLSLFGVQGATSVKWMAGKRTRSEMKYADDAVPADGMLKVDKSGYYTLLIQDQERQTRFLRVYVYIPYHA